ncbi:MAG: hypothetical protein RIC19_18755 [Phaeodactylibacter sp.]
MPSQSYLLGAIAVLALVAGQWWLALMAALMVLYFGFLAVNTPEKQAD